MPSPLRIAINGFGRIGRLVLRALLETQRKEFEVVALNGSGTPESDLHLLQYDSSHGPLPFPVKLTADAGDPFLEAMSQKIRILSEKDPLKLPWASLGIDIVLECSGRFTARLAATQHLTAGAGKVLISAPAEDADITIVYGVNHTQLTPHHRLVSNASCTTNCLAPVASVLHEAIGIVHGYMTTIHAYTGDQSLVDRHHADPRRARAAALSMVPSTTGAARAVGLVLPALKGKLDGTAIRVPTPNVSLIDFTFVAKRPTSVNEINEKILQAAQSPLKGILAINDLPLVSTDFNHNPASSIFDLSQTQVIDTTFCRILAWYDNEWGFSNRMLDVAALMGV